MAGKCNPYNKVIGCVFVFVSVCLYRRISLTAKPIGFSFTWIVSYVPGRFITIWGEGTTTLPREITKKNRLFLRRDLNTT